MSEWSMKRFWDTASAVEVTGGFQIELDGRNVKTPAKHALIVPTKRLAQAIAAEWDQQVHVVNPDKMPQTRLANSAIDKVAIQHSEVASLISEYGASDLLCYRADEPEALVERQAAEWNPILNWAKEEFDIALVLQTGLMPILQPQSSLDKIAAKTYKAEPFELTALHELVALTGSWVIGYAAFLTAFEQESLWSASVLDELFQEEQWGIDEEAFEMRTAKQKAFFDAWEFRCNLTPAV
ncbi:MAG: ATP12 family protein [Pseudomonadota bacterium]